jgi:outer membrane biosynthesis protein TonB
VAALSSIAYRSLATGVQDEKGGIGLNVQRDGKDLVMTWDPNAPAVQGARAGILSIVDGDYKRSMPLDPGQLRRGQVLYSPDSSDVLFQLQLVTAGNRRRTESVRMVDPVIPAPSVAQSRSAPARRDQLPPESSRKSVGGGESRSHSELPVAPKPVASKVQPPRAAPPPPAQAIAQAPTSIPSVRSSPPTVAEPVPSPASGAAPANTMNYAAPKVIHQVAPVVPQAMRPFVTRDVNVELMVSIDASGRMSRVQTLSSGSEFLTRLSTDALNQWRFQPAKLNDRNVPSQMKLVFKFRAGGK